MPPAGQVSRHGVQAADCARAVAPVPGGDDRLSLLSRTSPTASLLPFIFTDNTRKSQRVNQRRLQAPLLSSAEFSFF